MVPSRADDVLRHIERTARKEYLGIIGPEKGKTMNHLFRRINPKHILEVATLVGYSTIIIGKDLESDAEIVTIEIDEAEARKAEENIRKAEINPKVRILVGDALYIIATLNGEFDFVFLDATKSECLAYLRCVEDKLHEGSVVVADNAGISS